MEICLPQEQKMRRILGKYKITCITSLMFHQCNNRWQAQRIKFRKLNNVYKYVFCLNIIICLNNLLYFIIFTDAVNKVLNSFYSSEIVSLININLWSDLNILVVSLASVNVFYYKWFLHWNIFVQNLAFYVIEHKLP